MRFVKTLSTGAFALAATALVGQATSLPEGIAGIWGQNPRWNNFECKPTAAHPNPLVLLHGLGSEGTEHWSVFAPRFAALGYCVFSPTYGSLHGQTFVNGIDLIENSGHQLSEYIDRVLASTGASKVNILGHSEGTMVTNYYLLKMNGGPKVDRFAGIGGNFRGTDFHTFIKFLKTIGLYDTGKTLVDPLCKACDQLFLNSTFIKDLNANGDTVPNVKYLNIVTKFEEFVSPIESGFLQDDNPNVRRVYLQDLCPSDFSEHITLMASLTVFAAVNAFFDDSANQHIDCISAWIPV
ncbi:hypothetical protein DFQ26_004338 [Actinomortierella ambigua]|nr:hypothetical protein DFQ26_004325 [Actinomortierella ambigua]KAF9161678.1 hypothetical protein DFQ26_004338 [Actinomortierella ambigua]